PRRRHRDEPDADRDDGCRGSHLPHRRRRELAARPLAFRATTPYAFHLTPCRLSRDKRKEAAGSERESGRVKTIRISVKAAVAVAAVLLLVTAAASANGLGFLPP